MKTTYINYAGKKYSLTENTVKKMDEIAEAEHKIRQKATDLGKELDLDVFYGLKTFDDINGGWKKAYFFLIPIERWEVERIRAEYHANNQIGIYYNDKSRNTKPAEKEISGIDYEYMCADYLERNGYYDVEVTQASGDQGIDIIAWKDSIKYGIQCKYYKGSVGNKAVQEAFTGAKFYNCNKAMVMTSGEYTSSAIELANQIGVKLVEYKI